MFLHHVAHDFDATRHFLFVQVHPGVWWGNIVAGLFVFVVVNICWQWFLKKWVHKFLAVALKRHHDKVVQPVLDAHHEEQVRLAEVHHAAQMKLAKKHHEEHLAAIAAVKPTRSRKVGLNQEEKK